MLKTLKSILAQEREAYRIPRTVQDLIPVSRIWADGIFLCGKSENILHIICIYAENCVYLHRNSTETRRVGEKMILWLDEDWVGF